MLLLILICSMGCSLKEYSPICNKVAKQDLNRAVEEGDIAKVKKLISKGMDPNVALNGDRPLIIACSEGDIAIADTLIAGGADTKGALHAAVWAGKQKLLLHLLENRSLDINEKTRIKIGTKDLIFNSKKGMLMTPLMLASYFLLPSLTKFLIEKGANPLNRLESCDALSIACSYRSNNLYKNSISHFSLEKRANEVVEILLKGGAKVGEQHFEICGKEGDLNIFHLLMKGSRSFKEDNNNIIYFTALKAVECNNKKIYNLIYELKDEKLMEKLYYSSCFYGFTEISHAILSMGKDWQNNNALLSAIDGNRKGKNRDFHKTISTILDCDFYKILKQINLGMGITIFLASCSLSFFFRFGLQEYFITTLASILCYPVSYLFINLYLSLSFFMAKYMGTNNKKHFDKSLHSLIMRKFESGGDSTPIFERLERNGIGKGRVGYATLIYFLLYCDNEIDLSYYLKTSRLQVDWSAHLECLDAFFNGETLLIRAFLDKKWKSLKAIVPFSSIEEKRKLALRLSLETIDLYSVVKKDMSFVECFHLLDELALEIGKKGVGENALSHHKEVIKEIYSRTDIRGILLKNSTPNKNDDKVYINGEKISFEEVILDPHKYFDKDMAAWGILSKLMYLGEVETVGQLLKKLKDNIKSNGPRSYHCFHERFPDKKSINFNIGHYIGHKATFGQVEDIVEFANIIGGLGVIFNENENILLRCIHCPGLRKETFERLLHIWKDNGEYCKSCLNFLMVRAASYNKGDIIELLLKKGADVNAIDASFRIVHFCAREGKDKAFMALYNNGADIGAKGPNGISAIETLGVRSEIDLLGKICSGKLMKRYGKNMLHSAIRCQNVKLSEMLMGRGALSGSEELLEAFKVAVSVNSREIARLLSLGSPVEGEKTIYQELLERGKRDFYQILEDHTEDGVSAFSLLLSKPKLMFKKNRQYGSPKASITISWSEVPGSNIYKLVVKELLNKKEVYVVNTRGTSSTFDIGVGRYLVSLIAQACNVGNNSEATMIIEVDERPVRPKMKFATPVASNNRLVSVDVEWERNGNSSIQEYILKFWYDEDEESGATYVIWQDKAHKKIDNIEVDKFKKITFKLTSKMMDDNNLEKESWPDIQTLNIDYFLVDAKKSRRRKAFEFIKSEAGFSTSAIEESFNFLESRNFDLGELSLEKNKFLKNFIIQKTGRYRVINFANVDFKIFAFALDVDKKVSSLEHGKIVGELKSFLLQNRHLIEVKNFSIRSIEQFFEQFYDGTRIKKLEDLIAHTQQVFRIRGYDLSKIRENEEAREGELLTKINRVLYLILFSEFSISLDNKLMILGVVSSPNLCSADYLNSVNQAWWALFKMVNSSESNDLYTFITHNLKIYLDKIGQDLLIEMPDKQSNHSLEYIYDLLNKHYNLALDGELSPQYYSIIKQFTSKREYILSIMEEKLSLAVLSRYLNDKFNGSALARNNLQEYLDKRLEGGFNLYNNFLFEKGQGGSEDRGGAEYIEFYPEAIEALLVDLNMIKLET